jgi:glycosyltransferase involved in cell wall biosynthesis
MRVAVINGSVYPSPPPAYGSEAYVFYLSDTLGKMGHEVHLFAPGGSRPPVNGYLHYIPGSYGRIAMDCEAEVYNWYRDTLKSCDVVHDCSHTVRVVEELYLDDPKFPCLFTRNGIDFNMPRFGRRNAVVLSEAAKECAITNTSAWKGTDLEGSEFDCPPGAYRDCRVVRYGTDVNFYSPCGEKRGYILYVGRPHPAKGVDLLAKLAAEMPEQKFVLAWRPETDDHKYYNRMYHTEFSALGNVVFMPLPLCGHHEAKRELYRRAKVFVQPTRYVEAFGATAIEALACGTPVILWNKGSAPEIVKHGETGFLVDSLEELGEAVRRVGELDPAACRQDALERWTKERMARDYLKLYQDVLEGRWW